jgi:protein-tyrosine phosphatase
MRQVYRSFVEAPEARAAFAQVLQHIADADHATLFHCAAGKDRTGWAAALLLHLAGVPDQTVLEDYLLTNTFSSATREKYLGLVREHLGADKVDVYERVMVADEEYLHAGYDAVDAAYGDRMGYLRDGLGLDDGLRARLRDRLLS